MKVFGVSFTNNAGTHPLPWRLTKEAMDVVDRRVRNIVYPHGIPTVADANNSFVKDMGRVWRTRDRLVALLTVLPTASRGYIPALRAGIRKLVWGLKLLEGRCMTVNEAHESNCEAGCHLYYVHSDHTSHWSCMPNHY